jgi:undecaprenyl-diphosphatase
MFGAFGEAIVLGVVQGITEFLPISSDGHLALAELLFDLGEGGLSFFVMLHAGTLIATLIVLRQPVGRAVAAGVPASFRPARFKESAAGRDALVVLLASAPTAVIGLLLRDAVEHWTRNPVVIGLGFLGTTAMLLVAQFSPRGERDQPSVAGALLVGVAQGLAVLPGLSRSGSTIAVLLRLGVRPERAFTLSMLISLPAVLGAVLLESRHAFSEPFAAGPAFVGALVALGTGIVALLLLRRIVNLGRFGWFALWVGPLALATIAMGQSWPNR